MKGGIIARYRGQSCVLVCCERERRCVGALDHCEELRLLQGSWLGIRWAWDGVDLVNVECLDGV